MSIISVRGLTHVYSQGTPFEKVAIDQIDLDIEKGEFVGIIGQTGSGKSTFIQHLNALIKPTHGTVCFNGEDIFSSKAKMSATRFKVGLVFQYPEHQLFEETVYKDIAFGPKNMGLSDAEVDTRIREAAGFAGLSENIFEASPIELSGGQKRRAAIAGVIAMRPEVLVLDEPTAGLDPQGKASILENIVSYAEATGATIILVSHSMDDIARLASRLVVFSDGKIAMDGTPAQVFDAAQELKDIGLAIPKATEIALELKARGIDIPESIYTINYLRKTLLPMFGEVGKC